MSKSSSGVSICGCVFAVIAGLAIMSMLGVDIWRTEKIILNFKELSKIFNIRDPLQVFRYFFVTKKQMEFRKKFVNDTKIPRTRQLYVCTLNCSGGSASPGRQKRSAEMNEFKSLFKHKRSIVSTGDWIYHGCCRSRRVDVIPLSAMNLNNIERNIVQLDNHQQLFTAEECEPTGNGCNHCMCGQPEPFIYEAVVYTGITDTSDATRMEYDLIQLDGSCKCLNV